VNRNIINGNVTSILLNSVSASRVQFRAGSSRRGTGGSIHPASELIAHPQYDYYTVDFDIAVARVSDSTDYSFAYVLEINRLLV
jgi:hypothetical protein